MFGIKSVISRGKVLCQVLAILLALFTTSSIFVSTAALANVATGLTISATPTTFSGTGQTIHVTYTLDTSFYGSYTPTGSVTIWSNLFSNLSITCPGPYSNGMILVCNANYLTTSQDVATNVNEVVNNFTFARQGGGSIGGIQAPFRLLSTYQAPVTGVAPVITSAGATTFTVGTAGSFTVTTTGNPTAALSQTGSLPSGVTFTDNGNGTATLAGTPATGGSFPLTITATDGTAPNASQAFTLTVNKKTQSIAFNPMAAVTYAPGATVDLSTAAAATASSGLAVSYTSGSTSICTVSGTTANILSAGNCVIKADQVGNGAYAAATQVSQNLVVNKGNQTVSFTSTAPAAASFGGSTYTPTATATSNLTPVVISLDASSTACAINSGVVSFTGVGICALDATQTGNSVYASASATPLSFTVGKAAQVISFTKPADVTYVPNGTVFLSATGGASSNPVTFASTSAGVCTSGGQNGASVTFVSAGNCSITASQVGNANYANAADVPQTFAISQAPQVISFTKPSDVTYAPGLTVSLVATGGASGNAVPFTSSTTGVCTVSSTTATILTGGVCTIAANQLGNTNYQAALLVSQSFTVSKAAQTIALTSTPPKSIAAGGAPYNLAATGGASNNPVSFTTDATSGAGVCSVTPTGTVTFIKSGLCVIDANEAGDAQYAAAPQVQVSINVQDSTTPTTKAIGGFISDRGNMIVSNMWSQDRTIDRLNDAHNASGGGTTTQFKGTSTGPSALNAGARLGSQGGVVLPAADTPSANAAGAQDFYGLQQMVYSSLKQLGQNQGVNTLNYSGPFDAQMNVSDGMTGTFKASYSQFASWNQKRQQLQAASLGINASSLSASTYSPLDVWIEGTYAAVNSSQTGKFGLISTGADYVFNTNFLMGMFAQVDFMNETVDMYELARHLFS